MSDDDDLKVIGGKYHCVFCDRHRTEVKLLVYQESTGYGLCDDCVDRCTVLIAEERGAIASKGVRP